MKKKEELEILYGDIVLREVMEVIEKVMDDACSHVRLIVYCYSARYNYVELP